VKKCFKGMKFALILKGILCKEIFMAMKRILIIDDDKDLVSMLSMYLKTKDFDVRSAYSYSDIPEELGGVDLIILDINLPTRDGFDICKRIRDKWDMPILFLSVRVNEEDKIRGLMLGGDDYITKPFSLEGLYARVYTNLNRKERGKGKGLVLEKGLCSFGG